MSIRMSYIRLNDFFSENDTWYPMFKASIFMLTVSSEKLIFSHDFLASICSVFDKTTSALSTKLDQLPFGGMYMLAISQLRV